VKFKTFDTDCFFNNASSQKFTTVTDLILLIVAHLYVQSAHRHI